MRKLLLLIIMLMPCIGSVIVAQQYKAAELYEAKGPVKEIKYDWILPGQLINKQIFRKDGKQKWRWLFKYGEDGRVYGDSMTTDFLNIWFFFSYNNKEQLDTVEYTRLSVEKKERSYCKYIYTFTLNNETGLRDAMHLVRLDENGKIVLDANFIFSDYKFDDHGNWISREVQAEPLILPPGTEWDTDKIEQTRTIKYYKTRKK